MQSKRDASRVQLNEINVLLSGMTPDVAELACAYVCCVYNLMSASVTVSSSGIRKHLIDEFEG